ncbi:mitochondrial inner membrane i-AAA protease supercomplex subunit YME1 [Diplogelasinospora grovesii]|uniref:Mitochondrial inner membrane i-AAA protease supercomplex subunit YME1 n=1 Tax=Diplogelasinospora grovesii TaxID=303347 RepID=A0AAN6S1S2_9PEZI|nr:mitochondrial inner membrane i-AAA protease supercomplex subunit YME1 [Diplogelasinospora grovesii]
MAFHTSGLPSIAAATADLWPSIANTLMVPWRGSTSPKPRSLQRRTASTVTAPAPAPATGRAAAIEQSNSAVSAPATKRSELPDFLRDAILPQPQYIVAGRSVANLSPSNISSDMAAMPQRSLAMANPLIRRSFSALMSRPLGHAMPGLRALHTYQPSRMQPFRWTANPQTLQYRGFGTGGISRSLLASREAAANRNPNSATAQNAFYQVLLKANMPAIVVERYQSGRFATSEAADEAYQKALAMLNGSSAVAGQADSAIHASGLTPTQIQAVGQAVAAHTKGGNMAMAAAGPGVAGKTGPLHVIVDETFGSAALRWIKFVLYFCLFTYLSLVVVTMLIDGLNTFKRPGGKVDNTEAKAENQKARFADVHGCDEAKEELQELVDFLRNPDKFSNLGGKLPKGVLLVGPPGTGKTLLARAVAGEAGVPFFFMSGSEFEEVYVGVGAKRVRDLFASAKAKSPSIVFIDELDAIGGRRNSRDATYVRQTLNQLLTELDGFEQNSGVIIIAATNFPESLDKALTRPGRFDRHVTVSLPDVRGRIAILKHHAQRIKAAADVNLEAIASRTSGLSGAELENIVNQAAIHASKTKAKAVSQIDFEWAKDKVIMGTERKSMVITPREKEMTAYHEAGHALVAFFARDTASELYKVTILPRGQSLGHTAYLPEMDKHSYTVKDYLGFIDRAMGGKVAEEIVYGNELVTSGVSSDLDAATRTAWQMVAQLGMSEKLGPVEYLRKYEQLSSETRAMVESEVKRVLDDSYSRARNLLLSKRKELDLLAKALVEYETLDKAEVEKVIRGEKLKGRIAVPPGPMAIPKPVETMEPGLPIPLTDPVPGSGGGTGTGAPPAPAPPPAAAASDDASDKESR